MRAGCKFGGISDALPLYDRTYVRKEEYFEYKSKGFIINIYDVNNIFFDDRY